MLSNIPRYIGCKSGSYYKSEPVHNIFFCGSHCTDSLCGPRRTKTSINKRA